MSRDIRDIQYKFKSISPNIETDNIIDTNKNQKKKTNNDKINYYSYNRRKYNDKIKKNFFEKYNSLKWNNNVNNILYELDKMKNDFINDNMRIKVYNDNYNNYPQINYLNNNEENHNYNIENKPLNLPIIYNNYYYQETKDTIKNDDNNNDTNNDDICMDEEERKIKLQKIMDSYKYK